MKVHLIAPIFSLGVMLLLANGCVVPGPPGPPPVPVVEAYGEPPFVGAVWVGGAWRWHPEHNRYEWHHGEWRHRG